MYDKKTGKLHLNDIGIVAEERDFYRVKSEQFTSPLPNDDEFYYEHQYKNLIENDIPRIIKNVTASCTLCKRGVEALNDNDKKEIAKMIVLQLLRTPVARRYLTKKGEETFQSVINSIRDQLSEYGENAKRHLDILNVYKYTENVSKSFLLEHLTNENTLERYCSNIIQNRVWVIYENADHETVPILTSDNPVVLFNDITKEAGFGINALDNPATTIFFPLTPKYMVFLYHREFISLIGKSDDENKLLPVNQDFVIRMNKIQYEQCDRQAYRYPDREFSMCEHKID